MVGKIGNGSKYSQEKYKQIIEEYKNSNYSVHQIINKYGICLNTVYNKKSYKNTPKLIGMGIINNA